MVVVVPAVYFCNPRAGACGKVSHTTPCLLPVQFVAGVCLVCVSVKHPTVNMLKTGFRGFMLLWSRVCVLQSAAAALWSITTHLQIAGGDKPAGV